MELMEKYIKKIIASIPTPFYDIKYAPESYRELRTLLEISKKNKIDLLFLEALNSRMPLPYTIRDLLKKKRQERKEMMITANRILETLEEIGYRSTTFKSWTPFPAVPNDIDIIILDKISLREFKDIIKELKDKYKYQIFDTIPYAVSLHDTRKYLHKNPKFKDPYDIDLYYEVAANHLIYIDKLMYSRVFRTVEIDDEKIGIYTLTNEHELLTQLFHSVIPEQIFLLYHYYAYLYYMKNINKRLFISDVKRTCSECPVSLTLQIIKQIYSFVTNECNLVKKTLINIDDYHLNFFLTHGYYRFQLSEIFYCIVSKMRDNIFRKTFLDFIVNMVKPRTLYHVMNELLSRRVRITY